MTNVDSWEIEFEPCIYSNRLMNKLASLNETAKNKLDLLEVKKGLYYAKKYHANQKRQSGEPYYSHPIEVAYLVADYIFKTDIIVTSLLHDTLEDTELTKDMLSTIFGPLVANQVEDLTRIKADRKISSSELVESLWQEKKYDLLFVKQFDRFHNMQTISIKSPEKVDKIIRETMHTFLVLAAFFGMPDIEEKLSDLCLQAKLNQLGESSSKLRQKFSFEKDQQVLAPIIENEIYLNLILKSVGL